MFLFGGSKPPPYDRKLCRRKRYAACFDEVETATPEASLRSLLRNLSHLYVSFVRLCLTKHEQCGFEYRLMFYTQKVSFVKNVVPESLLLGEEEKQRNECSGDVKASQTICSLF